MDRQPLDFILRKYMPALPGILESIEQFTGARRGSVVLVPNATTGVNTVLSNLELNPGDEVVTTGQEYFASRNALRFYAERRGARVIEVPIEIPVAGPEQVVGAIMSRVTSRTALVLADHVSSPTGMVFPVETLARELDRLGVDLLVDGAHGPGMLPLDLEELGAAYYTGNCHKWMCTPQTAALLYVRPDRQAGFRPAVMSHFHTDFDVDMSPFQVEFSWNGTIDPTPRMAIPFAIRYMEGLHPEGWKGIMRDNHELAVAATELVSRETGLQPPCPLDMLGSMGSVVLPYLPPSVLPPPEGIDPLQDRLRSERGIEVPVTFTPNPSGRFLRFSCQLYNSLPQYEELASSLREELSRGIRL
ncbi:MAG: aminotransferase class V-fold PLP-dependent enzyme [Candidatus Fermentibacteraceae bacterium]|nr:aminotransferase class V-fold PLP-dependent enzyme [Candidatus Fermentibacteraceae bacterium]MBN2607844.1 aminotransferase class V-fold PLP-dependent enzyme [Candidatus Fermentibacteraceae bacterium]